jgi:phosphohistidine swiveling domain-containing protein
LKEKDELFIALFSKHNLISSYVLVKKGVVLSSNNCNSNLNFFSYEDIVRLFNKFSLCNKNKYLSFKYVNNKFIFKKIKDFEINCNLFFIFAEKNHIHFCLDDLDLKNINILLKKLRFNFEIKKIKKSKGSLFISFNDIDKIILFLYNNINNYSFINFFFKTTLNYHKKTLINLNNLKKYDNIELLFKAKRYFINLYFMDKFLNYLLSIFEFALRKDYGITEKTHKNIFLPYKLTLTSKNLLSILIKKKELYNDKIFYYNPHLCSDKVVLNLLKNRIKKSKTKIVNSFRKLIWLKDTNNFFIYTISQKLSLILKSQKIFNNLNDLCSISFSKLKKSNFQVQPIFINNKDNNLYKLDKVNSIFSLKGTIASAGNFSGIVKIIKHSNDLISVSSNNIIVTNKTQPSFVASMAICKGIIAEEGGLLSHAAVISRELGTPCVIGVKGAISFLKDGQKINVINGKIEIINK